MKLHSLISLFLSVFFLIFFVSCKNNGPYSPDYNNVNGYVIGKEKCNIDPSKDYWLIAFTLLPDTPLYGDTLVLNGITYTNVVKTKDLSPKLQGVGLKVFVDFKKITQQKIQTTGCNVVNPETYNLKEIFIIYQGEVR